VENLLQPQDIPKNLIDDVYKKIGENVKKIREEKGITQLELAIMIGFRSVGFISQAETYRNKQHFNIAHLTKIAYVLKVNIKDFFDGIDEIIKKENTKINHF